MRPSKCWQQRYHENDQKDQEVVAAAGFGQDEAQAQVRNTAHSYTSAVSSQVSSNCYFIVLYFHI